MVDGVNHTPANGGLPALRGTPLQADRGPGVVVSCLSMSVERSGSGLSCSRLAGSAHRALVRSLGKPRSRTTRSIRAGRTLSPCLRRCPCTWLTRVGPVCAATWCWSSRRRSTGATPPCCASGRLARDLCVTESLQQQRAHVPLTMRQRRQRVAGHAVCGRGQQARRLFQNARPSMSVPRWFVAGKWRVRNELSAAAVAA